MNKQEEQERQRLDEIAARTITKGPRVSNEQAGQERAQERRTKWGDNPRVRCTTPGGFFDGNLKEHFEKIGQNPSIGYNEIREIPAWLLERCISSGGTFEPVL